MAEVLWDQLKMQPKGLHHKDEQPFDSRSMDDVIGFLDGPHISEQECLVCLVIHNIDGPGLRDSDSQRLLARIASCSHVRIVASIDHVNAPLCKLLVNEKGIHVFLHIPPFTNCNILSHGQLVQFYRVMSF